MRAKKIVFLLLTTTLSILFFCFKTTSVSAEETNAISDADIVDVLYGNDEEYELTISYVLEADKKLILKTSEEKVVDIQKLEKEIGKSNVEQNSDKNEITLTLDDPDKFDFKLFVTKKKPFKLTALNSKGEFIFDKEFNTEDSSARDAFISDDIGWNQTDNFRISSGPKLEHVDGSTTIPYLYFGDYHYAKDNLPLIEAYWETKGKAKKYSITAPNTATLYADAKSRIEDGPDAPGNHIFTSHYGDNQYDDKFYYHLDQEVRPLGSPNSFTNTNLYNYVQKTDDWLKPGTAGPDKPGKSYSMYALPKLYYRKDPDTGFEEQKLVYEQQAFFTSKRGRDNPQITTTIHMKFDRAGKVITNINFKNTGNVMFNNFSGFSNHDLSLNKDGQEIRLINGKKAGNYIPMRSLGNERGMYIQSKNNQMRTSIYTNSPNGPYAWSARSYGYAYKATKGHMVSPGVLGIGYREHSYYPWAKGRRKPSKKYFDKSEGHYKLNYVAKVSNAFNSQRDLGDKNNNLVAGARISAKEKDPTWDAGLTMRTAPTDLKVDDSVNLEYITQNDVNNNLFSPVLEIDNKYTFDDPEIMKKGQDKLEIKCSWYDFDSTSETLYYSIDSDEESERQILLNAKQTSDEAVDGKIHELKGSIPLRGLSKGKHKIHLIMQDKEGNFSQVEEHVIFILHEASEENIAPSIAVMSPHSSEDEIHSPRDHSIDIKGIWHDKDSKEIKSITYQLDNEKETLLSENLDNSGFNEHNKWEIDKLDIKSKNDFDKHTIKFKITDAEGNIGTDEFHFKHVAGLYDLVAPDEFTFGQIVISSTDEIINSPKIQHDAKKNDNLVFRDWREKGSNPVGISLTINNFYKKEDLDDTDDGDDSEEDMDDDARKLNVESLIHQVYWKDKLVNGKSLLIGQSKGPKSDSWEESVDLTDDVLKQLRIGFKSHPDKQSLGDYSSRWTWQVVDSIQ